MPERSGPIGKPTSVTFDQLCQAVEELHPPDGCEAEVRGGRIVLTPRPPARHWRPMKSLRRQLQPHAPDGHDADSAPFLFVFPRSARAYGPDLFVADEAAFEHRSPRIPGEALSLVAELTSVSTKDDDWAEKVAVYGRQLPVHCWWTGRRRRPPSSGTRPSRATARGPRSPSARSSMFPSRSTSSSTPVSSTLPARAAAPPEPPHSFSISPPVRLTVRGGRR